MASLLGTRGETLSRIFRRLTEAGVIQVSIAEVTIFDPQRLQDLADGESDVI
ncbi:MAG: helix-turn-helix domain-containing protein [Planctomycetota bacterium]